MTTAGRVLITWLLVTTATVADDSLLKQADDATDQRYAMPVELSGTGRRSNPWRQRLRVPFSGDELFVRYRLRYDRRTIDLPSKGNGEFFVLWLDDAEGSDQSTHSGGVPNLGLHVAQGQNRFMVRYASGGERFGRPLEGDLEFLLVARLWKSTPGEYEPFDQLDLWVDPEAAEEFSPDASVRSARSIPVVKWIGFSTGAKTEAGDRITIRDIDVTRTWEQILQLPPKSDPPHTMTQSMPERTIDFTQHVLPILQDHCFDCHAGDEPESGVRLDVHDEVLNQTALHNADDSRLLQLISNGEMPPDDDPLPPESRATLRAWIDEGLDWNSDLLPAPVPQSEHWAFQPLRRPKIPQVQQPDWIRTPVDAFIARRHEEHGLAPAPPAEDHVLARRLSLDVTGLPPKSDLTRVDELLSQPSYGIRWARHWLDVARWAESNGHQHNRSRPHAWRYRDWVVDAFNSDKPFDGFIREQIAGDELRPFRSENIVATGFLAAARYSGNELDKEIQRNDILVDVANTTAQAFLGLTLECAQCHSHRFDPISLRDYYRFQAFFAHGQPQNIVLSDDSATQALLEERWQIFDSVHDRLVSIRRKRGHPEPIYVTPKSVVAGMKADEKQRFLELDRLIAGLPQSWSYYSPASAAQTLLVAPMEMRWPLPRDSFALEPRQTHLLVRGDIGSPGPEVTPGWPLVFGPAPDSSEFPRTSLADWIADPQNPLTARVWVNRIWQWHFGQGLVATSGDFGTQGTLPTHPELLDWLASELIDTEWSTRHIHRLILESSTYRQSSQYSEAGAATDPDNLLRWRWTPRRLEAEAVRDSILQVSGLLDHQMGGPSDPPESLRRSLYLTQKRDHFPDQQLLFDSAAGIASCSRRRTSTTPLQPLWLLNSDFVQQAAQALADRSGSVKQAVRLALGRDADPQERQQLQQLAEEHGLTSACLAILNTSEFIYIP